MDTPAVCPGCGAGLVADALAGGLCPACLLKLGLADTAGSGQQATAPDFSARSTGEHPDRIGSYRILEILGEGGMGIVYLAEQSDPIRRRVALKVIKPGMDTANVLARFEAERQALAVMSHPHIAKVFDAGVTEKGRPYFVMEYLPGIPITDYCDMRCLPIPDRLKLFVQVCDAIQHAHQKGIIHRDIKPSNVLVASQDGSPVMKVIDFGVAKAMGQPLTERTLFTQHGTLIGTSEYMSPEQAGRTPLDVDARTDIYSLGILLYELLVGARPFDPVSLRRAAVVEMERIIREEEPPKPTTKFSTLGERASEIARHRDTDVRSLARQLSGELEWITMRALEKDPARRYASASEFAADLLHHLLDEPVVAGPAARSYRLKKLVRKHRVLAAAGATLVAALVVGVTVSTWLYFRAETARQHAQADAARNRVEAEAMQALFWGDAATYETLSEQAMKLHRAALGPGNPALASYLLTRLYFLEFVFPDHKPAGLDDSLHELTELIERGLDAGEMSSVRTLLLLDDDERADETVMNRLYAKAFSVVRNSSAKGDETARGQLHLLADLLEKRLPESFPAGQEDSFEETLREVLVLRLKGHWPGSADVGRTRERLFTLLVRKANRLQRDANHEQAETTYREALSVAAQSDQTPQVRIAEIESNLGRSLLSLGRIEEGQSMLIKSLDVLRATVGDRSATTQQAANGLADSYVRQGNAQEADRYRQMLPAISVAEVRDIGTVSFVPHTRQQTGGFSAAMGGHSIWVFSNASISGRGEQGWKWLDSSWGVATIAPNGLPTIMNATPRTEEIRALLPLTSDEAAYDSSKQDARCTVDCGSRWIISPTTIVQDKAGQRLLVFYSKSLRQNDRSDRRAGNSIAVFRNFKSPALRPSVRPGSEEPTLLFGADEPSWGSGAVVVGDSLYAFACDCKGLACPCLLARAPVREALDRVTWRFYAGGGIWSADWRLSKPVLYRHPPLNVHWNEYLGKYVVVTAFLSHQIRIDTADRPDGPWSAESFTVEGLAPTFGFPWIESPVAHSELTRKGGRIQVLTYVRNVGFLRKEMRVVELEFRRNDGVFPKKEPLR